MTAGNGMFGPGSFTLAGRRAVVTGAARGIGRATAELFARLGADVAVCDRDADALAATGAAIAATGRGVYAAVLDVRDAEASAGFVAAAAERFEGLDILVNNAGGTFHAAFADVSAKGEAMLVAENFGQASHLTRLFLPHVPEHGGAIVNVSSIEAHQAAPGFAVYAAMKAALESLTKSLALELAPRGIRVNAMAPDGLVSEGEDGARDEMLAGGLPYEPAFVPPIGHRGTPEDGASVIAFLASDLARYVTGVTVHVDGGNGAAGGWHRVGPRD